jgi:hypothetical protein
MPICFVCQCGVGRMLKELFSRAEDLKGSDKNHMMLILAMQLTKAMQYGDNELVSDDTECDTWELELANSQPKVDISKLAMEFLNEAKSCISTLSTVHRVMKAYQHMFEVIMDELAADLVKTGMDCHNINENYDTLKSISGTGNQIFPQCPHGEYWGIS